MDEREHIQRELEGIAPKLAKLKSRKMDMAPPGYFSGLADKIISKVDVQSEENNVVKLNNWRFTIMRVAAILVVGLAAFFTWQYLQDLPGSPDNSNLLTENYIVENLDADLLIETIIAENIALNNTSGNEELNLNEYYLEEFDENLIIEEL